MKLWKLLPALAGLLLVGCENKPFMDLDFDIPIDGGDLIFSAIKQLGIEPSRIELMSMQQGRANERIEPADDSRMSNRYSIALIGRFSAQERLALRTTFDDILHSRAASNMDVELTLDATQERPHTQTLTMRLSPETGIKPMFKDDLHGSIWPRTRNGIIPTEVVCVFAGKLKGPLPIDVHRIAHSREQSYEHFNLVYLYGKSGIRGIPAHITIRDPQLRAAVAEQAMILWPEGYGYVRWNGTDIWNDREQPGLGVTVQVGSLGFRQWFTTNGQSYTINDDWRSKCAGKSDISRPLSFHVGAGLDRLKAVEYTYVDTPP